MADTKHELLMKALGPVADSIGETIQDIWDIAFGSIHLYAQRKSIERAQNLEAFKRSFEQKVIEIPPSAIKEPALSLLGPTLEASKYYFEEESIRELFATCAAASLDRRKERELHPSFPEIIKQLSPADAKNLPLFTMQRPVVEYYTKQRGSEARKTVLTNVFLANKAETDLDLQSRSISSLTRLGLIEVEYEKMLVAEKFYADFYTTPFFINLSMEAKARGITAGISPGRARPTALGKAFISVCLG